MADKDFTVKNGLVVNTSFTANSTLVNAAAINVVGRTNTATLFVTTSANIASSNVIANTAGLFVANSTGVVNAAVYSIGSSWIANSTTVVFGTSVGLQANGSIGSANQALFSNGTTVYWANVTGGAGYYKGNQGAAGSASNANNIFRINSNTISNNITISSGENAITTGPITVNTGFTLTIDTGGRAVII